MKTYEKIGIHLHQSHCSVVPENTVLLFPNLLHFIFPKSLHFFFLFTTIHVRQKQKIKLPDAVIAATALTNGLILVSRNTKDFKNIQGLEVIDPYGM